jgi:hypothetical protein
LRRLSSAIRDIWLAPADPDRWRIILAVTQNNGPVRVRREGRQLSLGLNSRGDYTPPWA